MKNLHFIFLLVLFIFTFTASSQTITTVAGNAIFGHNGDGGQATSARINPTGGVFVDASNNIFISERYFIRRVDGATGIITTICGTGMSGFSGDGGPAIDAQISYAFGIYEDAAGNIYFDDYFNNRIRKINTLGIISTIAGTGGFGYSGDGGPATSAELGLVQAITGDAAGNIYFADFATSTVRKIDLSGIITTIAGTGAFGYSGDGGLATEARLGAPNSVSFDAAGNLYISDDRPNVVRKVTPAGIITTIAGGSTSNGYSGDGGPATDALFCDIEMGTCDSAGNFYIADACNNVIRKVSAATGIITTIAGAGEAGYSGDGGPAVSAELNDPWGLSIANGNLYIVDRGNNVIRKIENIALPLTLLNFTGNFKNSNVNLNWVTGTEINTSHFNIQRSIDGSNFTTISKVNAAGNSSADRSYNYLDYNVDDLHVPTIYYRLQMIDLDGQFAYSGIIAVTINANNLFTLAPNPAKDYIVIKGNNIQQLQLFDITGKMIITKRITSQEERINITRVSKGIYVVRATNTNGQVASTKLVVD